MNHLECSVSTCANYNKGLCCRESIKVEGDHARSINDTCCSSFQERVTGLTNYAVNQVPNERLEVLCDAQKCVFNSNGCCSAQSIKVGGDGASSSGDTVCRTFRER